MNVSDAVKVTEQSPRQTYLEHCQMSKMERFVKRIMPKSAARYQKFCRAWRGGVGVVVELGHFDKHFVKNTRK